MIIHGLAGETWFSVARGHKLKITIGMKNGRTRARDKEGNLRGELYTDRESGQLRTWLDTGGGEPDTSRIDTGRER